MSPSRIRSLAEARACIHGVQAFLREHDSPQTAEDLKEAVVFVVQHALRTAGDAVLRAGAVAAQDEGE